MILGKINFLEKMEKDKNPENKSDVIAESELFLQLLQTDLDNKKKAKKQAALTKQKIEKTKKSLNTQLDALELQVEHEADQRFLEYAKAIENM